MNITPPVINPLSLFAVREALSPDLEQMAKLYHHHFSEHIMVQRNLLNNPSYLAEKIRNKDEKWVVAKTKEQIVIGVAALAISPPVGLAEIERVCVSAQYRGNNIAVNLCSALVDYAREIDLGFVETFARGNQPAMQRTFEKIGFKVYGVSPRFEIIHDGQVVREQFVHMGLELKPETVDEQKMVLITAAKRIYNQINDHF